MTSMPSEQKFLKNKNRPRRTAFGTTRRRQRILCSSLLYILYYLTLMTVPSKLTFQIDDGTDTRVSSRRQVVA